MREFASLTGKPAVVTGASSGIGRAIAFELARAGADVLLTCRTSVGALEETAAQIRATGRDAGTFVGDLADAATARRLIEVAWERFGRVGIWVNNAGADLLTGPGRDLTYDQKLDRLFAVDVAATVRLGRAAGERMRADGGVILTIGWDQADRGMEGDSGELFATAKNAIMGFTRSLALSLAPEVRVNCLAPGWIKTAWGAGAPEAWQGRVLRETPLRRWGTPEDIAKATRFLCSDEAAFITGQVVNVNGGAVR